MKPEKIRNKTFLIMPAAVLLTGCAAQQRVIDQNLVQQLTSTTSRTDVVQLLGRPTSTQSSRRGKTLLYLRHCPDNATTEPCASSIAGVRWQRCEIGFNEADLWEGIACSWTAYP